MGKYRHNWGSSSTTCHWMASSSEAASESSLDSSGLASSSSGSSSARSVLSILDQLKSPQPSEIED